MSLATHLGLLLLCSVAVIGKLSVSVTFDPDSGSYNPTEDVTITCLASGAPSDFSILTQFKIYKQQDPADGWKLVGKSKDTVVEPFSNNPDKYKVQLLYPYKDNMGEGAFILSIKGVEAMDSGDYKCSAGIADPFEESDPMPLVVLPGSDNNNIKLETDAPLDVEDSVSLFNIASRVTCSGDAQSLSTNLQLKMHLAEGDITQSFSESTSVKWVGDVSMKTPTKYLTLTANSWKPEIRGDTKLNCFLQDGSNRLAMQELPVRREDPLPETAKLECSSNYKKPVGVNDIDVIFSCDVKKYSVPAENVTLRWVFVHENKTVNITTGERGYQRIATVKDGKQILEISRVQPEMIDVGTIAEYEIFLLKDGESIASTTLQIQMDTTRRLTGVASNLAASLILIVCSMMISL